MIKPLLRKKEEQNISNPKKSPSLIPWISAIVCGFSYFWILGYMDRMSAVPFTEIDYTVIHWLMISAGILLLIIFSVIFHTLTGIELHLAEDQAIVILHVLSSIIPVFPGWMFGSKIKSFKIMAIVLFILFILVSIFMGFIFARS